MNDETQQTDARRLEKEEIEDLGTVTLARGEHVIHCLTVIGQIEGHTAAGGRAGGSSHRRPAGAAEHGRR